MTIIPSIFSFVPDVQVRQLYCACSGETCNDANKDASLKRPPLFPRAFFERKDPADQEERRKLFENNQLAITKDARFETEFARYPVLYVDFSVSN